MPNVLQSLAWILDLLMIKSNLWILLAITKIMMNLYLQDPVLGSLKIDIQVGDKLC
jgi:hypothetical protein